jgi:multidrug resistance efflux pump
MGDIITILLIGLAVGWTFWHFKIHVSSKSIAIATLIVGTVMFGGKLTVALWQGAAPVSRQITLTRFIVALNPDLKALIKTINVEIGEPVKKGDLLFELDKKQFQAPVDQYSAQLEAAKTEVDSLKAAVELSEATIKRLEAQSSTASVQRDAAQELYRKDKAAIAKLKVLEVARTAEAAEASVVEAQASNRQAVFALAGGRANVKVAQGLLDKAQSDLERTSFTAPADGVMINWQARPGTITAAVRASAAGTFMETADTRVVVVLPQNLLRNVAVGDPAEIAFMSRPGQVTSGKVIRIANYTGEGQLAPSGDVPIIANLGSKGFFAVVVRLDDVALAASLGLGEAGAATIYSQPEGIFHSVSRLYIRLISVLFYLT